MTEPTTTATAALATRLLAEGKRLEHQWQNDLDGKLTCAFCDSEAYVSDHNGDCRTLLRAAVDAQATEIATLRTTLLQIGSAFRLGIESGFTKK